MLKLIWICHRNMQNVHNTLCSGLLCYLLWYLLWCSWFALLPWLKSVHNKVGSSCPSESERIILPFKCLSLQERGAGDILLILSTPVCESVSLLALHMCLSAFVWMLITSFFMSQDCCLEVFNSSTLALTFQEKKCIYLSKKSLNFKW